MAQQEMYDGPIFDVQAHAIQPQLLNQLAGLMRKNDTLTTKTIDTVVDDVFAKLADDLKSDARRKALGSEGVQVVTINTFFPPMPADRLLDIVEGMNIWMSNATRDQTQFIGTASIPPPPILASAGNASDGTSYAAKGVQALRRALTELGLQGVLLASNYDGVFLGDAVFDPYFALAEELSVPVIIHPAVQPVEAAYIHHKNIPTFAGYLNDQRTTLLDLVMAGIYEKFPKVTVIATHLGGGILSSLGRFNVLLKRFPDEAWYIGLDGNKKMLPHPVESYLKRIFYDCNNAELRDIEHAAAVVGIDHLLTGTDFPWTDDSFSREILGQVKDAAVKKKLAYGNAASLFQC